MIERWTDLGTALAGFMFLWAILQYFVPLQLAYHLTKIAQKVMSFFNPYVHITIHEYTGKRVSRSKGYIAAEAYLSRACASQARSLKAILSKESRCFLVTINDRVDVVDEFCGTKIWWYASKHVRTNPWNLSEEERRYYRLTFHRRHRKRVEGEYLAYVLSEGCSITIENRQRRLYTNTSPNSSGLSRYKKVVWIHKAFEHPASFDTLAMDSLKKQEIKDDLEKFHAGKEYYAKIGKAWKRGYLVHGPAGTGKSTLIAAMANFLEYDVYNLNLTVSESNIELRRLLFETTGKSIIVIDLTNNPKDENKKSQKIGNEDGAESTQLAREDKMKEEENLKLLGYMHSIEGAWSTIGGERIIVFKTSHLIEKLNPTLMRKGLVDKKIGMTNCGFEAFKTLVKNYLGVKSHELFDTIRGLIEEVPITPAEVAENLMFFDSKEEDVNRCLQNLIHVLNSRRNNMFSN